MIRENLLRKKLESGEPTVATRIWSTNPFITETIGNSENFDYIEFAAEYAPFSQVDLENICRAAELYNMATLIKVDFQNRGYVAQKAMAAGFQAIMFTDHETPEQVRESIRLTTPATPDCKGLYGYPMRRFIGGQSHVPPMTHAQRVKQVVRCFMIEKVAAMENLAGHGYMRPTSYGWKSFDSITANMFADIRSGADVKETLDQTTEQLQQDFNQYK